MRKQSLKNFSKRAANLYRKHYNKNYYHKYFYTFIFIYEISDKKRRHMHILKLNKY